MTKTCMRVERVLLAACPLIMFVVGFAHMTALENIALGWLGVLTAPMAAPYLWAVLLGLGQNACFPLALTLIVLRGGSVISTSRLSTMVQTIGYLIAAVSPFAIGALHDLTGSWTPALIVLLVLVAPQMLFGLAAGRDRRIPAAVPEPTNITQDTSAGAPS